MEASWVFGEDSLVDVGWGFNRGEGSVQSVAVLVVGVEYEQVGTQYPFQASLCACSCFLLLFEAGMKRACGMSTCSRLLGRLY